MPKSSVYLLDLATAKRHLENRYLTCRTCGGRVSYYPYDDALRHQLIHAQGDERKRLEEMIAWFKDEQIVTALAKQALGSCDPIKFSEFGVKHGFLHRVRGEE
jgi:hypothetical protein